MPFCPRCRDEFQSWVKICPDCKIELVETLPPLTESKPELYLQPEPLVTVADFRYSAEAHLAKAKLASEDIPSILFDEYLLTANSLYLYAVGGIKLKVRESDFSMAVKVLTDVGNAISEQSKFSDEGCPRCKSTYIRYETFQLSSLNWILCLSFLFGVIMLGTFIFTIPFLKRKWHCDNCGFVWKE